MHRFSVTLLCLLASAIVAACSGIEMKPGGEVRNSREIPAGSGLLTGRNGEFVIYRSDEDGSVDEKEPPEEAE
jgi:hypothetical protein